MDLFSKNISKVYLFIKKIKKSRNIFWLNSKCIKCKFKEYNILNNTLLKEFYLSIGWKRLFQRYCNKKQNFTLKKKTLKAESQISSFLLKLYIPQLTQAPHILHTMTYNEKKKTRLWKNFLIETFHHFTKIHRDLSYPKVRFDFQR